MGTASIALAVCIATTGSHTKSDMVVDSVDMIEVNHRYDENGQFVFDQLLFYEWSPAKGHYDVRDWRLLKSPIQVPRRNPDTGRYIAVWRDGAVMRKVHAKTLRETWTQYDPEIVEQQFLAKDKRRALPKRTKLPTRRLRTVSRPCPNENRTAEQPSRRTVVR